MNDSRPSAPPSRAGNEKLSIIVPTYNEEGSVAELCDRLLATLDGLAAPFEIILVNDGSKDGTLAAMRAEAARRREIKVIALKRNSGQTAALMCGIDHSSGDIIISAQSLNDATGFVTSIRAYVRALTTYPSRSGAPAAEALLGWLLKKPERFAREDALALAGLATLKLR